MSSKKVPANLTPRMLKALDHAREEASRLRHGHIGSEHLLLALCNQADGPGMGVLRRAGATMSKLRETVGAIPVRPSSAGDLRVPHSYSVRLCEVLNDAALLARGLSHPYVGMEHVFSALLSREDSSVAKILARVDVDVRGLRAEIDASLRPARRATVTDATVREDFRSAEGHGFTPHSSTESGVGADPGAAARRGSVVAQFGRDLTALAKEGKIQAVIGRDLEVRQLSEVLMLKTKNNPLLVGEAGVGKTAIVEGLAHLIANDRVHESLRGKRLIQIDMTAIVGGTKFRGEFESRIRALLDEVARSPDIIIFIDELHSIVGAGRAEGSVDASNVMKPALARGDIRCIGATTMDEYSRYIQKDPALDRRFQPVVINETSEESTLEILRAIRPRYEKHHSNAQYTDAALHAAVRLSQRFFPDRQQPDKSIDVLDRAGARVRMKADALELDLRAIRAEVGDAVSRADFTTAARLRIKERDLLSQRAEAANARPIVDAQLIAEVVAEMAKVPTANVERTDPVRMVNLEETLSKSIIGQREAIEASARALRSGSAGFRDERRPVGSLLFLGPTGVGKTELAKRLAVEFCGSEDGLLAFDMSDYSESHSVAALTGSPAGYVGHEEGGRLTEAVRQNPHCVVLFDEIEKAHPHVHQLLLQILDEGRLTDKRGRVADFRNAVIVMTSNAGAAEAVQAASVKSMGFGGAASRPSSGTDFDQFSSRVMDGAKKVFRMELLNRIGEIIVFHPLERDDCSKILSLELQKFSARALAGPQNLTIQFDIKAREVLLEQGFDPAFGARPLRKAIKKHVEDPLSLAIFRGTIKQGDHVVALLGDNGQIEYCAVSNRREEKAAKGGS